MPVSNPTYCKPEAFELFQEQLSNINSPAGLVNTACAIGVHAHEDVDIPAVHAQFEDLATRIENRYTSTRPEVIMAHAHEVLFEEEGFVGNALDYYHPDNSFLPNVMQTRKGLPITLALVYTTIMRRLGLQAYGISSPGHFLAALDVSGKRVLIDAFHRGQLLHDDEARTRIESVMGVKLKANDDPFTIATPNIWIARILQNLVSVYRSRGQFADMSAMIELQGLL